MLSTLIANFSNSASFWYEANRNILQRLKAGGKKYRLQARSPDAGFRAQLFHGSAPPLAVSLLHCHARVALSLSLGVFLSLSLGVSLSWSVPLLEGPSLGLSLSSSELAGLVSYLGKVLPTAQAIGLKPNEGSQSFEPWVCVHRAPMLLL